MPISIFGFQALWSPWFFLSIALGVLLYFLITVKWRHKFEGSKPLTKKEATYFLLSMLFLYIIKGSPMDLLGHILFSVHMAQMALLLLIVAPFLIIGIPDWFWAQVFKVKVVDKVFRVFTKPVLSLLIFSVMFSIYHYPMVLDNVKMNIALHALFTLTIFTSAIFLWWPVVNSMPDHPKVHGLKKIGYVVLSAILITPACSLIIFVDVPVYDTYVSGEAWLKAMELCVPAGTLSGLAGLGVSGPELFTDMPTIQDQQLGGILMKVIQEIVYVFVIGKIFFAWAREERENADEITKEELLKHQNLTTHG